MKDFFILTETWMEECHNTHTLIGDVYGCKDNLIYYPTADSVKHYAVVLQYKKCNSTHIKLWFLTSDQKEYQPSLRDLYGLVN